MNGQGPSNSYLMVLAINVFMLSPDMCLLGSAMSLEASLILSVNSRKQRLTGLMSTAVKVGCEHWLPSG